VEYAALLILAEHARRTVIYKGIMNFRNTAVGRGNDRVVFMGIQLQSYFVSFILLVLLGKVAHE
jgi:hypothetical protein